MRVGPKSNSRTRPDRPLPCGMWNRPARLWRAVRLPAYRHPEATHFPPTLQRFPPPGAPNPPLPGYPLAAFTARRAVGPIFCNRGWENGPIGRNRYRVYSWKGVGARFFVIAAGSAGPGQGPRPGHRAGGPRRQFAGFCVSLYSIYRVIWENAIIGAKIAVPERRRQGWSPNSWGRP